MIVFRDKKEVCMVSARLLDRQYGAVLVYYKGKSAVFSLEIKMKKVLFFGDGAEKCKQMIQHPNARFIDGIFPSSKDMLEIANEKFAEKDFENVAYFEPFYLKDFVAGKKD